jgi:hypothetical protein
MLAEVFFFDSFSLSVRSCMSVEEAHKDGLGDCCGLLLVWLMRLIDTRLFHK